MTKTHQNKMADIADKVAGLARYYAKRVGKPPDVDDLAADCMLRVCCYLADNVAAESDDVLIGGARTAIKTQIRSYQRGCNGAQELTNGHGDEGEHDIFDNLTDAQMGPLQQLINAELVCELLDTYREDALAMAIIAHYIRPMRAVRSFVQIERDYGVSRQWVKVVRDKVLSTIRLLCSRVG